jgi:hypothetical protein
MHNSAELFTEDRGGPGAQHRQFCTDMGNGLHTLAQPLSILRSSIELLALSEANGLDRQRYLDLSAQQLERTCSIFASLQALIEPELQAARLVQVDLWSLVQPMIEDRRLKLQGLGIGIAESRPESLRPVFADVERTERSVAAVFETALSLSRRGDVIEVAVSQDEAFCHVTLKNTRNHGKRMTSANRFNLSLAETNIVSQQGQYSVVEDPFSVSFALPMCHRISLVVPAGADGTPNPPVCV